MVDRVERLTNLLALLLETNQALSLVQIAGELSGQYPEADQARRASFERDKAALRDIGVPIETDIVAGGPYAGQTVYRIDRRAYELADLELDPDEMRALQVAVAAVRTGSAAGQEAIWKLGGALGEERPSVSAVVPDRPELPVIRSAVASRSTIEFSYRGEPRRLDPWGLLLRGGFWYVIGYDHDRNEQRTFRVDRFDPDPRGITVGEPGSYERPPSFDPRSAFPADPKEIGHDAFDGVQALVHVDHVRAAAIERELGGERVVRRDDQGIVVSVPASNLPAFRSWVLGLLEHAVVLEPVDVREDIVSWLTAVASRNEAPA
jgi:predicted DNA-binding transcriptional regulator YafY